MVRSGDVSSAIQALQQYRAKYPTDHIDLGSIIRNAARPTILGYPESPKHRAELEERARAYGLQ